MFNRIEPSDYVNKSNYTTNETKEDDKIIELVINLLCAQDRPQETALRSIIDLKSNFHSYDKLIQKILLFVDKNDLFFLQGNFSISSWWLGQGQVNPELLQKLEKDLMNGDGKLALALLNNGFPATSDLLILAITHDQEEVTHKLIDMMTLNDLNKANGLGIIPILYVCRVGKGEVLLKLLQKGVDINTQDRHGKTPLQIACQSRPDIALLLIENKADVQIQDNHLMTALHYACDADQSAIAFQLILNGAYMSQKNSLGETPNLECLQPILKNIINGEMKNQKSAETKKELAEREQLVLNIIGHLSHIDSTIATNALSAACNNNFMDVAKSLIKKGVDPNAALSEICNQGSPYNSLEIAKKLIKLGADITSIDSSMIESEKLLRLQMKNYFKNAIVELNKINKYDPDLASLIHENLVKLKQVSEYNKDSDLIKKAFNNIKSIADKIDESQNLSVKIYGIDSNDEVKIFLESIKYALSDHSKSETFLTEDLKLILIFSNQTLNEHVYKKFHLLLKNNTISEVLQKLKSCDLDKMFSVKISLDTVNPNDEKLIRQLKNKQIKQSEIKLTQDFLKFYIGSDLDFQFKNGLESLVNHPIFLHGIENIPNIMRQLILKARFKDLLTQAAIDSLFKDDLDEYTQEFYEGMDRFLQGIDSRKFHTNNKELFTKGFTQIATNYGFPENPARFINVLNFKGNSITDIGIYFENVCDDILQSEAKLTPLNNWESALDRALSKELTNTWVNEFTNIFIKSIKENPQLIPRNTDELKTIKDSIMLCKNLLEQFQKEGYSVNSIEDFSLTQNVIANTVINYFKNLRKANLPLNVQNLEKFRIKPLNLPAAIPISQLLEVKNWQNRLRNQTNETEKNIGNLLVIQLEEKNLFPVNSKEMMELLRWIKLLPSHPVEVAAITLRRLVESKRQDNKLIDGIDNKDINKYYFEALIEYTLGNKPHEIQEATISLLNNINNTEIGLDINGKKYLVLLAQEISTASFTDGRPLDQFRVIQKFPIILQNLELSRVEDLNGCNLSELMLKKLLDAEKINFKEINLKELSNNLIENPRKSLLNISRSILSEVLGRSLDVETNKSIEAIIDSLDKSGVLNEIVKQISTLLKTFELGGIELNIEVSTKQLIDSLLSEISKIKKGEDSIIKPFFELAADEIKKVTDKVSEGKQNILDSLNPDKDPKLLLLFYPLLMLTLGSNIPTILVSSGALYAFGIFTRIYLENTPFVRQLGKYTINKLETPVMNTQLSNAFTKKADSIKELIEFINRIENLNLKQRISVIKNEIERIEKIVPQTLEEATRKTFLDKLLIESTNLKEIKNNLEIQLNIFTNLKKVTPEISHLIVKLGNRIFEKGSIDIGFSAYQQDKSDQSALNFMCRIAESLLKNVNRISPNILETPLNSLRQISKMTLSPKENKEDDENYLLSRQNSDDHALHKPTSNELALLNRVKSMPRPFLEVLNDLLAIHSMSNEEIDAISQSFTIGVNLINKVYTPEIIAQACKLYSIAFINQGEKIMIPKVHDLSPFLFDSIVLNLITMENFPKITNKGKEPIETSLKSNEEAKVSLLLLEVLRHLNHKNFGKTEMLLDDNGFNALKEMISTLFDWFKTNPNDELKHVSLAQLLSVLKQSETSDVKALNKADVNNLREKLILILSNLNNSINLQKVINRTTPDPIKSLNDFTIMIAGELLQGMRLKDPVISMANKSINGLQKHSAIKKIQEFGDTCLNLDSVNFNLNISIEGFIKKMKDDLNYLIANLKEGKIPSYEESKEQGILAPLLVNFTNHLAAAQQQRDLRSLRESYAPDFTFQLKNLLDQVSTNISTQKIYESIVSSLQSVGGIKRIQILEEKSFLTEKEQDELCLLKARSVSVSAGLIFNLIVESYNIKFPEVVSYLGDLGMNPSKQVDKRVALNLLINFVNSLLENEQTTQRLVSEVIKFLKA